MDDIKTQQVYTQARSKLICGPCKAARLLIWEKLGGDTQPQHATAQLQKGYWVAVHCDYFRRRIEAPQQLQRCGARRTKGKDQAATDDAE